jgi:hypothetical protein
MASPIEFRAHLTQRTQEQQSVFIAEINIAPLISPGGHMIKRTGEFNP